MKSIAKRMKIKYAKLRKVINSNADNAENAFKRNSNRKKFAKIHQRARSRIEYLL